MKTRMTMKMLTSSMKELRAALKTQKKQKKGMVLLLPNEQKEKTKKIKKQTMVKNCQKKRKVRERKRQRKKQAS